MTTTQTCHLHETLRLCSEMHHLSCMTYHFYANQNGIAAQTDTRHVHEKSLFGALPNGRAIGAGFEHLRTVADGCERLRTVADGCERLRTQKQRPANTALPSDSQVKREPFATHSGKTKAPLGCMVHLCSCLFRRIQRLRVGLMHRRMRKDHLEGHANSYLRLGPSDFGSKARFGVWKPKGFLSVLVPIVMLFCVSVYWYWMVLIGVWSKQVPRDGKARFRGLGHWLRVIKTVVSIPNGFATGLWPAKNLMSTCEILCDATRLAETKQVALPEFF